MISTKQRYYDAICRAEILRLSYHEEQVNKIIEAIDKMFKMMLSSEDIKLAKIRALEDAKKYKSNLSF